MTAAPRPVHERDCCCAPPPSLFSARSACGPSERAGRHLRSSAESARVRGATWDTETHHEAAAAQEAPLTRRPGPWQHDLPQPAIEGRHEGGGILCPSHLEDQILASHEAAQCGPKRPLPSRLSSSTARAAKLSLSSVRSFSRSLAHARLGEQRFQNRFSDDRLYRKPWPSIRSETGNYLRTALAPPKPVARQHNQESHLSKSINSD